MDSVHRDFAEGFYGSVTKELMEPWWNSGLIGSIFFLTLFLKNLLSVYAPAQLLPHTHTLQAVGVWVLCHGMNAQWNYSSGDAHFAPGEKKPDLTHVTPQKTQCVITASVI